MITYQTLIERVGPLQKFIKMTGRNYKTLTQKQKDKISDSQRYKSYRRIKRIIRKVQLSQRKKV